MIGARADGSTMGAHAIKGETARKIRVCGENSRESTASGWGRIGRGDSEWRTPAAWQSGGSGRGSASGLDSGAQGSPVSGGADWTGGDLICIPAAHGFGDGELGQPVADAPGTLWELQDIREFVRGWSCADHGRARPWLWQRVWRC